MNRNIVIVMACIVLAIAIAAVTIVTVTNHDSTLLTGFLVSAILPTVTGLMAYNSAEQAKKNTNGLLHTTMARADAAEKKLAEVQTDANTTGN